MTLWLKSLLHNHEAWRLGYRMYATSCKPGILDCKHLQLQLQGI